RRAPPPFPTRRSSDLQRQRQAVAHPPAALAAQAHVALGAGAVPGLRTQAQAAGAGFAEAVVLQAGVIHADVRGQGGARQAEAMTDRKSTRLNSSHVKI